MGDTLTQIAFKFKASQRQIRKVNVMLDDTIMPGETLLIPIIDQEADCGVAIISQTQDFTITHKIDAPTMIELAGQRQSIELQQSGMIPPANNTEDTNKVQTKLSVAGEDEQS